MDGKKKKKQTDSQKNKMHPAAILAEAK